MGDRKKFRDEMDEDERAGADLRGALAAHDAAEAGTPPKQANAYGWAIKQGVSKCPRCGVYLMPGEEVARDGYGVEVCARHVAKPGGE